MVKSKTDETRNAEVLVKQQLWRNGYSVKDVSNFAEYDLLVNDTIKVEVKHADYKQLKDKLVWRVKDIVITPNRPDILALVLETPLNKQVIHYVRWSRDIVEKLHEEGIAVIKDEPQISGQVCELKIDPEQLKKYFASGPAGALKD